MHAPWVAGTGHRTLTLGDPTWVAEHLPKAAVWLRDNAGTRAGISGLALGFDMDWAEAVLDAGLDLWVAIPFEEQSARWTRAERARWTRLRQAAKRERIIGTIPDDVPAKQRSAHVNRLLFKRNTHMINTAVAVITDWEPGRLTGGTAAALLEATKRALPGIHLDPVNRRTTFQLPDPADLERFALQNTSCGHIAYVGTRIENTQRLAGLTAVHRTSWRIRPARARETWDDGCDACLDDLATSVNPYAPAAA